jgi:hypothetical protein
LHYTTQKLHPTKERANGKERNEVISKEQSRAIQKKKKNKKKKKKKKGEVAPPSRPASDAVPTTARDSAPNSLSVIIAPFQIAILPSKILWSLTVSVRCIFLIIWQLYLSRGPGIRSPVVGTPGDFTERKAVSKYREVLIERIPKKNVGHFVQWYRKLVLEDCMVVQSTIPFQLKLIGRGVEYRLAETHGFCWKIFIGVFEFI